MILRNDQDIFCNKIIGALPAHNNLCAQLPTGGGKTICFSSISSRYIKRNQFNSVLISVHRQELIKQTIKTLYNANGIIAQPIVAGMRSVPEARVYVGMIESTHKRLAHLPPIGLKIIDEAHIAVHNKLIDDLPSPYTIGFSATPVMTSRKNPMNKFYSEIVCGASIHELIELHSLAQNVTYAPKDVVERTKLQVKNNEFDDRFMGNEFSKPRYVQNIIDAYEKWSKHDKTIIFNCNIEHSKKVNAAFIAAGYNSMHLDGTMTDLERMHILNWFKHTHDAILNNVAIATVGFDEPTIRTVIVNRATMSMSLWLQICGRGSRYLVNKSMFTIIDMGANAITHGDWCDDRDWHYLFHNPRLPANGAAPIKLCPVCDYINHAAAQICKGTLETGEDCGYVFPVKLSPIEEKFEEFVMLTRNIDVHKIINENKHRKENYVFYKIGIELADEAKKTFSHIDDKIATFILSKYNTLVKQWCVDTKKTYSQWMQRTAPEHLFSELKKRFAKWMNPLEAGTHVNEY